MHIFDATEANITKVPMSVFMIEGLSAKQAF